MRPSLSNIFMESFRTTTHYYRYLNHTPKTSPNKNIPIIVFPGFLTGDWSTYPLRNHLNTRGFRAYGWGQGTNDGFSLKKLRDLSALIDRLHKKHKQPVILIGWSLGGLYARELSRMSPSVSKVVTLASPFANLFANYFVDAYQIINNESPKGLAVIAEMIKTPLKVPSLNLYTKYDGVVHWMSCFHDGDELATAIEVKTSHTGMGFEPKVFEHIVKFIS